MPRVLQGRNLVYSAPTSAGKSAVSEILMIRRLIQSRRPALLVLPFVSLCAEKVAHLEPLLAPLDKCAPRFFRYLKYGPGCFYGHDLVCSPMRNT